MIDMKNVIAQNILKLLKSQNKKQTELAEAIGTNKQTINKILNGSRMINAIELKDIAEFFEVKMEDLTRIPKVYNDKDITYVFMGKITSEQGKEALKHANDLSNLIIFHKKVRSNGTAMSEKWD